MHHMPIYSPVFARAAHTRATELPRRAASNTLDRLKIKPVTAGEPLHCTAPPLPLCRFIQINGPLSSPVAEAEEVLVHVPNCAQVHACTSGYLCGTLSAVAWPRHPMPSSQCHVMSDVMLHVPEAATGNAWPSISALGCQQIHTSYMHMPGWTRTSPEPIAATADQSIASRQSIGEKKSSSCLWTSPKGSLSSLRQTSPTGQ
ncbi:hypothetical protein GGI35DRAFT_456296 [Trichoderma velutinum]